MADKDNSNTNTKQFDFETMAVVLYAMQESGVNLGTKHYQMMADISGKGPASFQHQFRAVKARAKELAEQAKNGGTPKPATPAKKGTGGDKKSTPATGEKSGTKRARNGKKGDGDDEESPTKKVKAEPVKDGDDAKGDREDDEF